MPRYERFAPIKDAPSDEKVTKIHNLLISAKKDIFFADRELILLLSRPEVSGILGIPIGRDDVSRSIFGDLIATEQIREWSSLPGIYRSKNGRTEGISLLSIFEYMLKLDGGIIESSGKFPLDENQVALRKDVLRRILVQVPDWEKRITSKHE